MKNITLENLINLLMFSYILSIYIFSFRLDLNLISNGIAFLLIGSIWSNFLLLRKKLVFNKYLLVNLLFIFACLGSVFIAINQEVALNRVITLLLIYILALSLINYIDDFVKLHKIINYFVYSGFIASIYILVSSDFSDMNRYGEELGNVNAMGMIIAISTTFCLYLIFLKKKHFMYSLILLVNTSVILLTGSRKSLLFLLITFIIIIFTAQGPGLYKKIKALLVSIGILLFSYYIIINIPIFYQIIGVRLENLIAFVFGEGTQEGSINERATMIKYGIEWFKEKPILGYGIDNFRFLYGGTIGGQYTYSHNNFIELLIGIGLIGTFFFYFSHLTVLKNLVLDKEKNKDKRLLNYTFLSIIFAYILLSVGVVYYYDKHLSIIVALGSIITKIFYNTNNKVTQ